MSNRSTWLIIVAGLTLIGLLGWWVMRASNAAAPTAAITVDDREAARKWSEALTAARPLDAPRPWADAGGVDGDPSASADAGDDERAEDLVFDDAGVSVLQFKRLLARNAEAATRTVEKFCELSRKVAKVRAYEPRPDGHRDAAAFMNSRVDWEGGVVGSLHLPKSLTDRMANQKWLDFGAADYAGLDFTWLAQVLEFDTWSVDLAGPLRDSANVNFFEAPIPNFVSLMQWAKLRLVKGAIEGDVGQASREVRHLADLCGSTNLLIGEMIRSALFGVERQFYARQKLPLPDDVATEAEAAQFRRAAFAGMYFLFPGVPKSVREKALACTASRCSATLEAIGMSASARDVVPEAKENLSWLLSQKPCNEGLAQRIATGPTATNATLNKFEEDAYDLDQLLSPDAGSF